jgi:hypothetical protein
MAIVLDDSMSMRVRLGRSTRFDRARAGAFELLSSTREGDAVAVVLAGSPPRVALAATADLGAARAVVESVTQSDRGTDLDGALATARALLAEMPQVDKRIVVLSDLADGHPDAPPLGKDSDLPVWIPLPELREATTDCGILQADRAGDHLRVRVACGGKVAAASESAKEAGSRSREVAVLSGEKVLAHAPIALGGGSEDVALSLSEDDGKATEFAPLFARLTPGDAIEADDVAPVVAEASPGSVAVIADAADESTVTGGGPIVEQALRALALEVTLRPLPAVPDRVEDLSPLLGAIIDDPPGFTPEQRRALSAFVEGGGSLLLALGPRAASAPLGASLEPILPHVVTWEPTASQGVDPKTAAPSLVESAMSGVDLDAKKRAVLAPEDRGTFEALLAWSDGAPFVARRRLGRGEAWIVTLPLGADASDLPLRPLFLALLDAWTAEARTRVAPRRTPAGVAWTFPDARAVLVTGPRGDVPVLREGGPPRAVPGILGTYRITVDDKKEQRFVAPLEAEMNLTPRAVAETAVWQGAGDSRPAVDMSPWLAFSLLGLMLLELGLRLRARSRESIA